jgi:hypothetical protein
MSNLKFTSRYHRFVAWSLSAVAFGAIVTGCGQN